MASYSQHHTVPVLAITFSWRGRPRILKLGRVAAGILMCVLPLLGAWYFGATAYVVFHDQLLASLISRQADMQYSYEDRIAVLRSQLERETSRSLVDRQTLSTTIQDLASRGETLEARAAAIDALVRGSGSALPSADDRGDRFRLSNPFSATPPSPLPRSALGFEPTSGTSNLRPDTTSETERGGMGEAPHAELLPDQLGQKLAATFSRVEGRQADVLARLRDPMLRAVERMRTALAETGLPASHWGDLRRSADGVGGPFVPLPAGAGNMTFEQNLALLQSAIAYQKRLAEIVQKVPLRQPLVGRLEVTSPFGARLDPFYGRAAMHTGVDLMGAYGAAVRATADGFVTVAGKDGGYGQMVEIDHGNGLVTRYAHLSSVDVSVGEHVANGAIVGRIGSTGRATGPHLHYETRVNGEAVDPARFLKAGAWLPGD